MSSCSFQKTPKSEESLGKSSFSSSASTLAAPPSQDPALRGSCNCGNVTYTSTVLPTSFTNCHCITCRKLSGAPYITFGSYLRSAITFSGTVKLNKSEVAIRSHCAECGSPVSMQYMCEPDEIHLTAGTIDLESVRGTLPKVKQCIFVSKKNGIWYDVVDEHKIPKYEKFSSGFQRKIDGWKKVFTDPGSGLG